MHKRTHRFLLVLAILLSAGGISQAGIIAQYDPFADTGIWALDWLRTDYILAQTFVPTATGTLASIDTVMAKRSSTATNPITFMITAVWDTGYNGLQPDFTNVLSTGTMSPSDPPLVVDAKIWVNTSMSAAELQAGTPYMLLAMGAQDSDEYYWWQRTGGTGYADGNMLAGWAGDSLGNQWAYDLPFRINASDATVPEPGTWLGLGMGLLALGALKRRFAQK